MSVGWPPELLSADLHVLASELASALGEVERLGDPAALAGDPAALGAAADAWRGTANDLRWLIEGLRVDSQRVLAGGWHEPASEAFGRSLADAGSQAEALADDFDRAAMALEDAAARLTMLRDQLMTAVGEAQGLLRALRGAPDPVLLVHASGHVPELVARLRDSVRSLEAAWLALSDVMLALRLLFEHLARSVPSARTAPVPAARPVTLPGPRPGGVGYAPGIEATWPRPAMPTDRPAGGIDPRAAVAAAAAVAAVLAAIAFARKSDLGQVDQTARRHGIEDRRAFGQWLEREKRSDPGSANDRGDYTPQELDDKARQYKQEGGR